MRLSEAIRLGAMLRPQGHGAYITEDGGTCALGAALDADGISSAFTPPILERWPILKLAVGQCPGCPAWYPRKHYGSLDTLEDAIILLNDSHAWTRERIADFVETIEQQQDASQPATAQEAVTA